LAPITRCCSRRRPELSQHTFLVVDANGAAGYQAAADYVFELNNPAHLANLSVHDFFT